MGGGGLALALRADGPGFRARSHRRHQAVRRGEVMRPLVCCSRPHRRTTQTCRTSSVGDARDAGKGLFQHAYAHSPRIYSVRVACAASFAIWSPFAHLSPPSRVCRVCFYCRLVFVLEFPLYAYVIRQAASSLSLAVPHRHTIPAPVPLSPS